MTTEGEKFLNLFEARFYEFGRRIADFESHKEEFKKLNAQTQELCSKFYKLLDEQASKELENKKKSDLLEKHLAYLGERIQENLLKISGLDAEKEKAKVEHDNLRKSVGHLGDKQVEVERKTESLTASDNELLNNLKSSEVLVHKLQSQIQVLRDELADGKLKDGILQRDVLSIQTDMQRLANDAKAAIESVKTFEDKLVDKLRNFSMSFDRRFSEVPGLINQRFDSIRIPDVSGFVDKETVTRIERLVELNAMDAKNAFLKSNNTEMQQQLLNKKIENVQILLKSFEYSNEK